MLKNILKYLVIFLGILIIFAFIALIYGMYLKISTNSKDVFLDNKKISINLLNNEQIIDIKVIDDDSQIYASVVSGTYQGEDHESNPSDGLFRSLDNGLTWQQVLPNIPSQDIPYSPSDIEITSSGKIFVGTMKNLSGDGGAIILSSTTGEIGTWDINDDYKNLIEQSNTNNIPGRIVLSSCISAPEVLYAVIGSGFINNIGFNLSYGN